MIKYGVGARIIGITWIAAHWSRCPASTFSLQFEAISRSRKAI